MNSSGFLLLNGKVIEFDALKKGDIQIETIAADDFENNTLVFLRDWIIGRGTFTVYTSGSTGYPKPIEISRNQMCISSRWTINTLGLNEGDKALVCINTSFIGGKMMLIRGFEGKMSMIVNSPTSNPLSIFSDDDHLDFMALVPLQLETILAETPNKIDLLNRMKAIILGGAPVNASLEEKIQSLIVPVYSTYGMTETVSHIALRKLNGENRKDYFQAFPLVDLGVDERGCLTIKSVLTNHKLLITNDIVELLTPFSFKWIGRIDNVINTGGVKVQIEKVENEITKIFSRTNISNRFFIGALPNAKLGETVNLFLEGSNLEKSLEEKIIKEISRVLPKYEIPKNIFYIKNFFETPTGKVKRKDTINYYKQLFT
jgi:o-succinylbenzoate---CoA ligase